MPRHDCIISDFHILRPSYESQQENTFDWIAAAHLKAEDSLRGGQWAAEERETFRENLRALIQRVGCKSNDYRGHVIPDFLHQNWSKMDVYKLDESPQGSLLEKRQNIHQDVTESVFAKLYAKDSIPDALIHVSCTGYASPSPAQIMVSKNGWGEQTTVTNMFHSGCYASIPALNVASGFSLQQTPRVDIVHTELCTLHFNPTLHTAEQLVMQTLFSDGLIKYSIFPEKSPEKAALKVLAIHQQVLPDSLDKMSWLLSDWGFRFTLSKEVPTVIAEHVHSFVKALCKQAQLDDREMLQHALFAIHPGGPKIVDQIQQLLGLHDEQVMHSREILRRYGNMSSATLPHIWEALLSDPEVRAPIKIISLAFGPGLTIAGNVLEKLP